MDAKIDGVLKELDSRQGESLAGLNDFLRIPSVSTKPEHAADLQRCAQWLAGKLREAKLDVKVEPTKGHPIVLAKNEHKPGRKTVLFYGHYDVQPPEPMEQWISPAFEPTVRKTNANTDAIFARGAVDDKGQVWAHVEAISAWQRHGGIPVNLTMLIEGEEEIGSDNLENFLRARKNDLKADIAVISDTGFFARGVPAIGYGLRGLVYMEVFIGGPSHDLHSGGYGGSVPNPANVLVELLATLHDKDGRVNIPGFYDDVVPISKSERDEWAQLPHKDADLLRDLKLTGLTGETGYSTIERQWARPTLDINGLTSGYQGQGAKTIIPAKAGAKVSMRLVPNQDPAKIESAFKKTLRDRCPKNVKLEFAEHGKSAAVITPREGPAMAAATRAVEQAFGKKPILIRGGGSIPVVGQIKSILGMDTLLVGFGLPDDRVHSPNEKFDLDCLFRGTRAAAILYHELSATK
ncbi:MAG TPA: dipeptidase [Tepidisphaeraceae bacterium]|jgi:acetylornithine deacetylase/succinyl-diaminopimelate desuccinylase-like protein|nr:dipeptidase [Tepidisphaeraceae bacterium]